MVVVLVLAMTVPSPVLSVVAAQRPRVPLTAPDTVPAWVSAPKNLARDTGASYQYYADIILVSFTPNATQTERQAAIDAVNGEVVGGQPMPTGEGFYYVRLNARRRLEPLANAVTKLLSFPRVAAASLLTPLKWQSRGPSHVSTVRSAASAVVVGSVLDSAGRHPVHPSRVELASSSAFVLGDSLGRFALPAVPRGKQTLRVRGIGFIEQRISIVVDRDTVRLPDTHLWRNHTLDSVRIIAP